MMRGGFNIASARLSQLIGPAHFPISQRSLSLPKLTTTRLFTSSTVQNSPSPFRLSSNKDKPSPTSDSTTSSSSYSSSLPPEDFSDVYYSPYKPKRQWPPDMTKLSPKHQFRLERKYRRRAALKYARPKFMKTVTLAQWVVIGFVAIYAVLFMEWDTRDTPFDGIRESFFSALRTVFSSPPPPGPVRREKTQGES
ncbi:hypothetical protein NUU61_003896 [Penicillium alfredii]|uniref:Uncharacterized protein n=1 Tax=Penicillium alfredii TaxID=1506179 RepID=A0A9W9FKA8_9EURO|nr:uncharacterized protein NUU61_003896 [Penicillium alfredii]KAJ5101674.1 hypothetical protein NUU61_003896 [Penicillium alfredii]